MMKWLLCGVVICTVTTAQAEIYKWRDASGVTRYSDQRPPSATRYSVLSRDSFTRVETPSLETARPSPSTKVDATEEAKQLKAQVEALKDKQNQRQCKELRARIGLLQAGGRIAYINPQGERSYYTDEETTKELAQAQKDLTKHCQ